MSDYFSWQDKRTRRPNSLPEGPAAETEERVAPSEPIEVQEFNGASTTVIQRIRGAIAKRFRGEL